MGPAKYGSTNSISQIERQERNRTKKKWEIGRNKKAQLRCAIGAKKYEEVEAEKEAERESNIAPAPIQFNATLSHRLLTAKRSFHFALSCPLFSLDGEPALL